jgi:dihydroxyacetone kinase
MFVYLSASLEQVAEMGQYVIDHSATLGIALNHCHVPGSSTDVPPLGPLETELGMGIHNEPGLTRLPWMDARSLVKHILDRLIDQDDKDRAYLHLPSNKNGGGNALVTTPVVLFVNNLGGTPSLEFNVIVKEAVEAITKVPHLHLERVVSGSFVTSLNMPGFSLSLLTLDDNMGLLLELLDYPVHVAGWPLSVSRSTFTLYQDTAPPSKNIKQSTSLDEGKL